jgi:hypothetical protein
MEIDLEAGGLGESRKNRPKVINAILGGFENDKGVISILQDRARKGCIDRVRK